MGATGSVLRFALLLLSKGPTEPKAKRPTIPVPVPVSSFQSKVPYRLTSWGGGRQVRCGGEVPAFGEALAQVKTPHTARVRAQQWQPAIPTPPPGKEHTRQAHLSSPVFVASPRLSPSLHAVQFFTSSKEMCSSSLGASQPAFDRASPRTQHPSQANAQKKGKM